MKVDITSFCARESSRFRLSRPWACGGWLYATDGRIVVRIPTDAPDDEPDVFPPAKTLEWPRCAEATHPLPPLPPTDEWVKDDCPECGGTGKASSPCPVCDGVGEHDCPECDETHECGRCDGSGDIRSDELCGVCRGVRSILRPPNLSILGSNAMLPWRYREAMDQLRNLVHTAPMPPDNLMAFRFDGGEGLVMLREPEEGGL